MKRHWIITTKPKCCPDCKILLSIQEEIVCWGAGGRWRCVTHYVTRARLNLGMVEQLDLVGRTGSTLAEIFF